ncbi:MAG TPA: malonic semialdehyde reductase [Burkholderiales bacterium]|nr:malonic semialdehyde reductase [Burkholderiales bacterium]
MDDDKTLDLILRQARSHGDFHDRPVDVELLRAAHEIMKWGPTTANSQPARILYLFSREARERMRPALSPVNLEKTMKAPLVAIVAYDTRFYEFLPRMYHKPDAINWYNKPAVAEVNAFRNSSLQGAYLIIALRAVGLDCGAMSGFDNAKLDAAFFPDGRLKSNFLINIGYGTGAGIAPRNPRFAFDEQCRIL